jgi:hypothetical protein
LWVFFIDGITEGFKTSAPYGDVTDLPIKMPMESPRDSKRQHRTVTCPVCRQRSRRNHRRNNPSVKPSVKVNISPLTRPYPPYFSFFFLISTLPNCKQPAPPLQKKSPSSQHNKSYILKSSCHSIRVLIYRRIFISFYK